MPNPRPAIERRRKFFYAETLAGLYDRTIDLVVPQYRLLHETMVHLIQNHFEHHPSATTGRRKVILDIGSGTGAEALRILSEFPSSHIVAVDACQPMHIELRRNFALMFGEEKDFEEHFTTITADLLSPESSPEALLSALPEHCGQKGFQAVITAFTIHHLSHDEKKEAYRRAYSCLEPGGLFINGDLFSYVSPELSRQAHEYDIKWIETQFSHPSPEFQEAQSLIKERRDEMRRRWIEHYLTNNILEPLESSEANEGQIDMLRSIGFTDVACPLRFWQGGILWARK